MVLEQELAVQYILVLADTNLGFRNGLAQADVLGSQKEALRGGMIDNLDLAKVKQ